MNRQETDVYEFLIIGSQAILRSVPDAPRELHAKLLSTILVISYLQPRPPLLRAIVEAKEAVRKASSAF
jgi:hypothetical protein